MSLPRWSGWALVLGSMLTFCCSRSESSDNFSEPSTAPSDSASQAPSVQAPGRVQALLRIENTRSIEEIEETDLHHGDVRVRRAAARALARADSFQHREKLYSLLADHDSEVLSWAAHGLGQVCSWDREQVTNRLVMRGVNLGIEPGSPMNRLDPWVALTLALGKCASPTAEKTLVAWLSGPKNRSIGATTGLGNVVTHHKRMEEETAAALLRTARGDAANDPLSDALFPFGRLKRAPVRVEEQLIEACRRRLGHAVASRLFVLRALGTLGDEAVPMLGSVLRAETGYAPAEQVEAARALGRLGTEASKKELVAALEEMAPPSDPVALTSLVGPGFGTLTTVLGAIAPETRSSASMKLVDLNLPESAPASVKRRVVMLRCASARIVAGSQHDHPKLMNCDPTSSDVGVLARLAVVDRGKLTGSRAKVALSFLDAKQTASVKEAAWRMIANHPEVDNLGDRMAESLKDEKLGVVTEAALVLAAQPDRFMTSTEPPKPLPAVLKALQAALKRNWPPDAIETMGALAKASGALRWEEAKPWLEKLCEGPNPTLRKHAKAALTSFGGPIPACEAKKHYEPAKELDQLATQVRTIEIDSDVGKLYIELDPELAPVAATRIAALITQKFYDDMAVHRVAPGFVVQFGDREGDGYGRSGEEPLRCETSPISFEQGVVGMALGGRDTGSSQIFVTLGLAPHLDGEYAIIGRATGPWEVLAEGDRLQKLRFVEKP